MLFVKTPYPRPQNNIDSNRAFDLSVSSKMQLFHSVHNRYITHSGSRFQIYDECFPNQFLRSNKRSSTLLGTYPIPKVLKTMLHKTYATSQWINNWSIVSPSHQHMQHQPADKKPHLIRLSHVKTLKLLSNQRMRPFLGAFLFCFVC